MGASRQGLFGLQEATKRHQIQDQPAQSQYYCFRYKKLNRDAQMINFLENESLTSLSIMIYYQITRHNKQQVI